MTHMRNSNLLAALLVWGLLAFPRQLVKDMRKFRIRILHNSIIYADGLGLLVCCSLGEKAFSLAARAGNLQKDLDSRRAD